MDTNRQVDPEPRPDADYDETTRILKQIAEAARALTDRSLRDTIVPEGGE